MGPGHDGLHIDLHGLIGAESNLGGNRVLSRMEESHSIHSAF